jgi:hypothetical protein
VSIAGTLGTGDGGVDGADGPDEGDDDGSEDDPGAGDEDEGDGDGDRDGDGETADCRDGDGDGLDGDGFGDGDDDGDGDGDGRGVGGRSPDWGPREDATAPEVSERRSGPEDCCDDAPGSRDTAGVCGIVYASGDPGNSGSSGSVSSGRRRRRTSARGNRSAGSLTMSALITSASGPVSVVWGTASWTTAVTVLTGSPSTS